MSAERKKPAAAPKKRPEKGELPNEEPDVSEKEKGGEFEGEGGSIEVDAPLRDQIDRKQPTQGT
jgi:hypothetical protein